MGKKVRKQVTLTEEEAAALAREAERRGVTEAEVIREGIQRMCHPSHRSPMADWDHGYEVKPISDENRAEVLRLLEEIERDAQERLAERGGKLYPESWPDIRQDREERSERWR